MANQVRFLGIVSNAASGFDRIVLPEPFKVRKWHRKCVIEFLRGFEELPEHELDTLLEERLSVIILPQKRCHVITANFPPECEPRNPTTESLMTAWQTEDLLIAKLEARLTELRLFQEGNIRLGAHYVYKKQNDRQEFLTASTAVNVVSGPSLGLEYVYNDFKRWAIEYRIPSRLEYLSLAHLYYDRSYESEEHAYAFLMLMIALEILFNDGEGELTYRISRGAAVLLSEGEQDGITLQKQVKKLYKKRSGLVHRGISNIDSKDVKDLRFILRIAIMKVTALGFKKNELSHQLTSSGMGDFAAVKPW